MKGYWFLCRCLIVTRNLLFCKCNKLTNHFRAPLPHVMWGTRVAHYGVVSFNFRSGACVWETAWMDYLKWWAGVCSWPPPLRWCRQPPPHGIALPSAARRPPLNGWLRPQTYWRENGFRWPDTRSDTDGHSRPNSFNGVALHYQNILSWRHYQSAWSYLILLDDAILLVRGRRVPWYTNGGAVMTPYCQHCHLLWWRARCWLEKKNNKTLWRNVR